jgi:hypothetical protein
VILGSSKLSRQALNRTLLHRQHLLARSTMAPVAMVEHLVGLQAQENLPPYLSLAARIDGFSPAAVSEALGDKALVRLLVMRGTIHLLTPDDALTLRQFTQACQDRERKASQNTKPAQHLDTEAVNAAVRVVLADGPLPMKDLGLVLSERFPEVPPNALAHLARVNQPLVQLPPRGQWKASGGVVHQYVDRWLERALIEPDVPTIVSRYLAAFGPGTAADVSAWSGVTGLVATVKAMAADGTLVEHHDERGMVLYDVPDAQLLTGDEPAPVRLLGTYDNVWLSHARRDRVTGLDKRKRWMGTNGGMANTLFVDGWLEGLWRLEDGRVRVVSLFRDLTPEEQRDLDEEVERTQALLDT